MNFHGYKLIILIEILNLVIYLIEYVSIVYELSLKIQKYCYKIS